MTTQSEKEPAAPEQRKKSTWKKVAYRSVNILFPLGEVMRVGKVTSSSISNNFRRIRKLKATLKAEKKEQLTFDEAVAVSGHSITLLVRKFIFMKRFWWCIATICLLFIPVLAIMILLSASSLSWITIVRALTFLIVLLATAGIAATHVVNCQYRLWQLDNRRLRPEEGATFQDFRQQTRWLRNSANPF